MSTRGTVAVKIDGKIKSSYNHSDSYPSWLGNRVLEFLKDADLHEVRRQARALEPVPDREPSIEEVKRLKPYIDLGVSTGSTKEWYCVLRGTQGDLAKILDAGFYEPFPVGAEEWSYVVDLDAERLTIFDFDTQVADIPFAELPEEFLDDKLSV
jgi:hypothetical protein